MMKMSKRILVVLLALLLPLLLAVPAAAAQACVDKAVASPTLKGILAFTPATVVVPERILFYRVDIFVELEKLLFFLKEQEKQH